MKNKWLRRSVLFLAAGCLSISLTGCKGKEMIDTVLEKVHLKTVQETESEKTKKEVEPEVPVEKPELVSNLSGSVTYKPGDTAAPLTVEATASDGGVITYQWYQSQTNTNGGGTIIEGATQSSYTPSTQEVGMMYYYVVATNTIKSSTNRITSDTIEVIISEENAEGAAVEEQEKPTEETHQETEQKTEENQEQSSEEKPAENSEQKAEEKPAE